MNTPKIPHHHHQWFDTMVQAAWDGNLALVSCLDAKTKEPRSVICLVDYEADGSMVMVPVGHLCTEDNPFEAYIPPESIATLKARDST